MKGTDIGAKIILILLVIQVTIWGAKFSSISKSISNRLGAIESALFTNTNREKEYVDNWPIDNKQIMISFRPVHDAHCYTNAYPVLLEEIEEVSGIYTNRNSDGTYIDLVRMNGKLYKVCK